MKRRRYFWGLYLSGVIFLGCIFGFLVRAHSQNLSEQQTTMIDFIERETYTEVEGGITSIVSAHTENQMDYFTEAEEDTESIVLEQTESETAAVDVQEAFYSTPLTEELKEYITGKSYPDTTEPIQISYDVLAYVHILHYDFEGQVQEGELICNEAIAQDLVDIFYTLYERQYAIEKVRLIDAYNADDDLSMADNNTSCFNYRTVPGKSKLSNHSYGYAIDINPLYNPYVRTRNGTELISPENGAAYADRSADFPHKIDKNDLCYQLFIEHGFEWGGAWNSSKDYQHFEKTKKE